MSRENEIELSTHAPAPPSSSSTKNEPPLVELFRVAPVHELPRTVRILPEPRVSERAPATSLSAGRRLRRMLLHGIPRCFVVAMLVWGLCFNFSEVRGSSMEPGIHDRDRILVDHVSYLLHEVERGDIVILRYPLDPSVDYIKRVVGLPGDVIVLAGGKLWVNGELVDEPYVAAAAIDPYSRTRIVVEPDHYFVLGDNRLRSSDSREFGQVSRELLRGKVQVRIWPLGRVGWIR
jgi:signal peptidase I